jgi:DNA-binding NarL/FixJ family response regulator
VAKPSVLIADDHGLMADGLARLLAEEYEVIGTVQDGKTLVTEALRLRPDVICLDITMPRLNGIQAATELSEALPSTKLIVVTQHLDLHYLRAAFRAGAVGYVSKHSAGQELMAALRDAFAGKLYITPLLADSATAGGEALVRNPGSIFTDSLTTRQREVLTLIAEGKSIKEIAWELNISNKTVEFHKAGLMDSLGLRTTAQLTRYAIKHNLVAQED